MIKQMNAILLTGGTSFIGRNVLPSLQNCYYIAAPGHTELDVCSQKNVDEYLATNHFNILIHLAAGRRGEDETKRSLEILRSFFLFKRRADRFQKILYIGSGAEYDQAHNIKTVTEYDIGKNIPKAPYALAKYILNNAARKSVNIYNLRIFGCYGPFEDSSRFFHHAIDCCLKNKPITIRQDCYFNYLYVEDLAYIMRWFIENKPQYHDYNVASGKPVLLSEIAQIIAGKMGNLKGIEILKKGLNNDYTASNQRLLSEIKNLKFTSMEEGINKQIAWQSSVVSPKKACVDCNRHAH
jgi:GDP-L-fucose synthase